MNDPILIVPYDPHWPREFNAEKTRILMAVGLQVVALEHIGSTAVVGLGAKPVIDLMVAVKELGDAQACIQPMIGLGYEYVPEFEAEMPERRYFRKGMPRTHQVHLVELKSEFWARHFLFRDYLRNHPEASRAYEKLKRDLAAEFKHDRNGYTDAKTAFIKSVEALANTEARTTVKHAELP